MDACHWPLVSSNALQCSTFSFSFFAKAIQQLSGNIQYFRGRKAFGAVSRSALIDVNKPLVQVHNEPLQPRSKPVFFTWNWLCNPSNDDAAGDLGVGGAVKITRVSSQQCVAKYLRSGFTRVTPKTGGSLPSSHQQAAAHSMMNLKWPDR